MIIISHFSQDKGRISQTESEEEEVVNKKKLKDKKKKGMKEEDRKKKKAKKTESLSAGPLASYVGSGVPQEVLDMPVDPNEPTYCTCQQVQTSKHF
jgi:hypothetical protein